jgi:hypothetical protein
MDMLLVANTGVEILVDVQITQCAQVKINKPLDPILFFLDTPQKKQSSFLSSLHSKQDFLIMPRINKRQRTAISKSSAQRFLHKIFIVPQRIAKLAFSDCLAKPPSTSV